MKCDHNVVVDVTPEAMGKALANASPADFSEFWSSWEKSCTKEAKDEIAKLWVKHNYNSLRHFTDFMRMIDYHKLEIKK